MKVLSRDFTRKEKVLIALLLLVLIGLAYYQFLDQPVRDRIMRAESEESALQTELTGILAKIAVLEKMQAELDSFDESVSIMASYNNSKAELSLLNDILSQTSSYSVSFNNVARSGDQIRRSFTLQFSTRTYSEMERVLKQLADSHYRCLLGDIRCTVTQYRSKHYDYFGIGTAPVEYSVNVSANATFYETMVGGTPDAGLPADARASN